MEDEEAQQRFVDLADRLREAQGEQMCSPMQIRIFSILTRPLLPSMAADVEGKLSSIRQIESEITSLTPGVTITEAQYICDALKPSLKNQNQQLALAALILIPDLLSIIDTHHSHTVLGLVNSLTTIALERSGDAKDRVRDAAAKAVVTIGKTALAAPASGASLSSSRSAETPIVAFERILRDSGIAAKSARIKEQVRR